MRLVYAVLLALTLPAAWADEPAPVTSLSWVELAAAPIVVVARVDVDPAAVREAAERSGFVSVDLEVIDLVKGRAGTHLEAHAQVGERTGVDPAPFLALDGQDALVTLEHRGRDQVLCVRRLVPVTPDDVAAVRIELAHQRSLLARFPRERAGERKDAEVAAEIERLTTKDAQAGVDALVALGPEAVPAIIRRLDDRRPYGAHLVLTNRFPHPIEAKRHYAPKVVLDALTEVLAQITRQCFGFLGNGGTEGERDHAVAGWRIYLLRTRSSR
jgi:hypothetical protein